MNFLSLLSNTLNYSYSSVSGYRSAISKYHKGHNSNPIGVDRQVKSVTRATFITNPPIPRYTHIWNVDTLLSYLETLYPLDTLSDFDLCLKTCALCAIFSISRSSSLAGLGPSFQRVDDEVIIPLNILEKNSKPGKSYKL